MLASEGVIVYNEVESEDETMIAKQRHQHILDLVAAQAFVSIQEMTTITDSSEATIRRDLLKLEAEGLLERVHGGAMKKNQSLSEASMQTKKQQACTQKQLVAAYVAKQYVQAGQVVYLDAGTATQQLIPYLANKNISVVTNGIHHIPKLLEHGIQTTLLGGQIKPLTQAVIGTQALYQLSHYAFDCCFLGVNSIDEQFGCSTPDEAEAALKQLVIRQSAQAIVLADASKFHQRSFVRFARFEEVKIITDSCPQVYRQYPESIEEVSQ